MIKKLLLKFSDESVWECDALLVARNRAKYYVSKDSKAVFEDEVDVALHSHELVDWAQGNMDWDDLDPVMVEPPYVDWHRDEFHCGNATIDIVTD